MIQSQDDNISGKNYNLSSNVKDFSFYFAVKFFIVSAIKPFMRLPSWCYTC